MTLPDLSFQQMILPLPLLCASATPAASSNAAGSTAVSKTLRGLCMCRHSVLVAVFFHRSEVDGQFLVPLQISDQILQRRDTDHRHPVILFHFLHRGQFASAALHAVQCDHHPAWNSA